MKYIPALPIVLYAAALVLPAYEARGDFPGYLVLAMGWMGLVILQPAWLANPIFFVALAVHLQDRRKGLPWAMASLGFAAFSVFFRKMPYDNGFAAVDWKLGSLVWGAALLSLAASCAWHSSLGDPITEHPPDSGNGRSQPPESAP